MTVTLAIAAVFPTLIDKFTGLTGGTNGMVGRQMSAPGLVPRRHDDAGRPGDYHYFVIVAIAAVMFVERAAARSQPDRPGVRRDPRVALQRLRLRDRREPLQGLRVRDQRGLRRCRRLACS